MVLHDDTFWSIILANFLHDFTITSTIIQFPPRLYDNFIHDCTNFLTTNLHISSKMLTYNVHIPTILQNICSKNGYQLSSIVLQLQGYVLDFTI